MISYLSFIEKHQSFVLSLVAPSESDGTVDSALAHCKVEIRIHITIT
jgi:hypothetical protein